jgi:hypothetical protein
MFGTQRKGEPMRKTMLVFAVMLFTILGPRAAQDGLQSKAAARSKPHSCSGSGSGGHAYSTTFPLTENPVCESGNWINGGKTGLKWCNDETTPGKAFGVGPCSTQYADPTAVLTGVWGSNQYVSGTVYVGSLPAVIYYPEVELRLNTTIAANSITGYEIDCTVGTATQHLIPGLAIVRWNGPVANFTMLEHENTTWCHNGNVLSASNVGGSINAYINGVLTLSATDTIYSDGSPGIGFNAQEGSYYNLSGFTNFSATDSGIPVVPVFNPADVVVAGAISSVGG